MDSLVVQSAERDMSKERSSALGTDGRGGSNAKGRDGAAALFRDGLENNNNNNSSSKKRLEDVVEKSSPSTSRGGIGREKERLAPSTSAPGRRLQPAIDGRTTQDKNRYQAEGAILLCFVSVLHQIGCSALFAKFFFCCLTVACLV